MRTAVILALALALQSGCSDAPNEDDCRRLLGHMVSLEAGSGGAGAADGEAQKNLEAEKKKLATFLEEDFMKYCLDELPRKQVECALEARSLEAAAECDEG